MNLVKTEKLVIPTLPMAQLSSMKIDDLVALARDGVELEAKSVNHTKAHKLSFCSEAKVLVELKRRYFKAVEMGAIASTVSFPEYFQNNTGGLPNNHVQSCAKTWSAFVDGGYVTETEFDGCKTDYLEKAAPIITALKGQLKNEDGTPKAETLEVAVILKTRPKDSREKLLAIYERLAGRKTMTQEKAIELLDKLIADGYLVTAQHRLAAEYAHLKDTGTAHAAFCATDLAISAFERNAGIPRETLVAWVAEIQAAQVAKEKAETPVQVKGKTAKQPAKETPVAA